MLKVSFSPINRLQQVLHRDTACGTTSLSKNEPSLITNHPGLVSRDLIFENKFANLVELANNLQAVNSISWTLEWDSSLAMPQSSIPYRAWQMSYLAKLSHELLTSEKTKDLLKYFEHEQNLNKLDTYERVLLREIRNQYEKGKNIPAELLQELTTITGHTQAIWSEANEANDFSVFIPSLEKITFLKCKMAEHIGYTGSPYNALLEAYEPEMTTEKLDKLFEKLKKELIPMARKINGLSQKIDTSFLNKFYASKDQLELGKELLKHIKFDLSRGRLDQGNNSFSLGLTPNDVRLVSYIFEHNIFYTISLILHEGFHGLYDQGFDPALAKTPLFDASSVGMHESQARLGELIIGQGLPFWEFYFPKLKDYFPEQFKDVSLEQFYRAINNVQPSTVWSEADEVACNLHVSILYEIEKGLIEGKLSASEVSAFWTKKMEEYCEIIPPNDTICSHWSSGDIGYLPTYTLGNIYAATIYKTMKKEIPDLEEQIANGNMAVPVDWLREKIYKYGKMETPREIIQRITGKPFDLESLADNYISYVKEKYSKIYNINL